MVLSERQSERLLDTPLLGQLPLPFASWLRDPAYRDATNGAPMAEVRKRPGVPAVAGEPLFTTDEVRRKVGRALAVCTPGGMCPTSS